MNRGNDTDLERGGGILPFPLAGSYLDPNFDTVIGWANMVLNLYAAHPLFDLPSRCWTPWWYVSLHLLQSWCKWVGRKQPRGSFYSVTLHLCELDIFPSQSHFWEATTELSGKRKRKRKQLRVGRLRTNYWPNPDHCLNRFTFTTRLKGTEGGGRICHRIDGLHLFLLYRMRNSGSSLPQHYTIQKTNKKGGHAQ